MPFDQHTVFNLAVALLAGLAVGVERQWSGKAEGPNARFAGVRTFALLGLASGLAAIFWSAGLTGPAVVLLAGLSAIVVIAYFAASRRDVDGTTEVGAFVVMAAGVLAGLGYLAVASGITALTVLLLFEKTRLHTFVSALDREELRAGARFFVMAAVILPLLPSGPFGPFGGVRPKLLWGLVLFFSGLSFVGFVVRRTVGRGRGYAVGGTLGGLVSSTSTTLTYARFSRSDPGSARALAAGALGANVMLFPRVLMASAVIAPALAATVWPAFLPPALVGALFFSRLWRSGNGDGETSPADRNPLQVVAAVQMAALFQLVLWGVWLARAYLGEQGLYGSAVVLGLVDMDALTVSLATQAAAGLDAGIAARALTVGVLSNTCVKLGITLAIGGHGFRPRAAAGLVAMAILLAAALAWWTF
jgi:uncharacterized membrane protein (DUF4010 family)